MDAIYMLLAFIGLYMLLALKCRADQFFSKLNNPNDAYFWGDKKWSCWLERDIYRYVFRVYRGPAQVFAIGFTKRDGAGMNLMIVTHFKEDCTGGLKGSHARHIPLVVKWKYPMGRVRSFFYGLQAKIVYKWLFVDRKQPV